MGETWSKSSMGRVRVCTANCGNTVEPFPTIEDRYVAIFGGGFDRERLNRRGNWLYMIDIETGHVLYRANSSCGVNASAGCASPTYFGSIPSEPASIDQDDDGTIDVIYVGDLKGRLWRIDTTDLRLLTGVTGRLENKIDVDAGTGRPFVLFEAPQPVDPEKHPFYPIYYRPSVISLGFTVSGKPAVGIAFGTGDRDDITSNIEPLALTYPQRFYYVIDRSNTVTRTESDLLKIDSPTAAAVTTAPANGWFIQLILGEKVNANSLTLGGVIFFPTFNPLAASNTTNPCTGNVPECGISNGTARLYRVFFATGNPLTGSDRGSNVPYGGFLSNPTGFQASDQSIKVWVLNQETSEPPKDVKDDRKTTVKSWKERSRRP
jgi:Tfp pilus tip-associated adhesin PilY1